MFSNDLCSAWLQFSLSPHLGCFVECTFSIVLFQWWHVCVVSLSLREEWIKIKKWRTARDHEWKMCIHHSRVDKQDVVADME